VLTPNQQGSVNLIRLLLAGKPAQVPRLAFNIMAVRDRAELHIRAMTTAEANGERFIALGDSLLVHDVASVLRRGLGKAAAKVLTRQMPRRGQCVAANGGVD
jgi:nucleoside-diphosphate-sugar epimerase